MPRDFSNKLQETVKGLEPITACQSPRGYKLNEDVLLVIQSQGHSVMGGRFNHTLRRGTVTGRHVEKKRTGQYTQDLPTEALRIKVTHTGEEDSGLVEKPRPMNASYFYDYIVAAFRVNSNGNNIR